MTIKEIGKEMTSEEIRKLITEKCISQILLGDRKLTDKELDIWRAGYYDGITDGSKYSIARAKEMFDTTLHKKGEENK